MGVLQFVLAQVWAMEPGAHRRMMEIINRHADGVKLTEEELVAATGDTKPKRPSELTVDANGVATIPIHGVIAHRAAAVGRLSSRVGTSVEHIRADLDEALGRDDVSSIVLDVDSPGGSVAGIAELGEEIRAARDRKPIVAHTDSLMASAAYWLAAQANSVVATKSAEVGSIGVISAFFDGHRHAANAGFDPVIIKSTPGKGGMQSNGSLSDADRADIQRSVDHYHQLFVEAVAAGRHVDAATAKIMGDGRTYIGADAKQRGFVDSVGSRASAVKEARALARKAAAAATGDDDKTIADAIDKFPKPDGDVPAGANSPTEVPMTIKTEPDPKGATVPPTAPSPTPNVAQIAADARDMERARCLTILSSVTASQHDAAVKLISDGTPTEAALLQINRELNERVEAQKTLPSASTKSLANGNTAVVTASGTEDARIKAMPEGEEKWKAEFAASEALQAEFKRDFSLYRGWKRNEALVEEMRG